CDHLAHGRVDLLRLYLAREHFRDEPVHGGIVVPADHCQLDLTSSYRRAQSTGQVNGHPAATQAHDSHRVFHFHRFPPSATHSPAGGLAVDSASSLRPATRRGMTNSRVPPFSPRSLNKCRNAFGPATLARACTRVLYSREVSTSQVSGRTAGTSHFQAVFGYPRAVACSSPIRAREIP